MSCHTMFALMSFIANTIFVLLGNKCLQSRWSIAHYKCVHIWADIFVCIFFYGVFDMPHSVKAAVNIMKCLEDRVNTLKSGIDPEDTDLSFCCFFKRCISEWQICVHEYIWCMSKHKWHSKHSVSSSFCTIFLKENKLKCRTNVFVLIDVIFVFLVGDLTDSELFFS